MSNNVIFPRFPNSDKNQCFPSKNSCNGLLTFSQRNLIDKKYVFVKKIFSDLVSILRKLHKISHIQNGRENSCKQKLIGLLVGLVQDVGRSEKQSNIVLFLVAKLLYKSKFPSVSMSVCPSGLGGNVIFSAPN